MITRLSSAILQTYSRLAVEFVCRTNAAIGTKVRFYGKPVIAMAPDSRLIVGDRAVLISVSKYTALGVAHPCVLRVLRPGALIEIGADSGISGATICAASRVSIGAECLLGANVSIFDTNFHPLQPVGRRYCKDSSLIGSNPVVLGRNVFVGMSSIILPGTEIGDDCVVAAGSVVRGNFPPGVIIAGNPARIVGVVPQ